MRSDLVALTLVLSAFTSSASAKDKFQACEDAKQKTPAFQLIKLRLYTGDPIIYEQVLDQGQLTPEESKALGELIALEDGGCKGILLERIAKRSPARLPAYANWYARRLAIDMKLLSGEIPVGTANRLYIEATRHFEVENAAASADEAARAAAAAQLAASQVLMTQALSRQPVNRITTTQCSWIGNLLNCTTQ